MCLGSTLPSNYRREGYFISWNGRGISNKKEELEILAKNLMQKFNANCFFSSRKKIKGKS